MNTFKTELYSIWNKRNRIILFILLAIGLFATNQGISEYKRIMANKINFQKNDSILTRMINNYDVYSDFGVSVFFVPSPSHILMTNPVITTGLYGKVNSIIALEINLKSKGRLFAGQNSPFVFRFSNIILYLGVLAVLCLGYDATRHKEYFKTLSCYRSLRSTFNMAIAARLTLITISFILFLILSLALFKFRSVPFVTSDWSGLLAYSLVSLVTLYFFLLIGTLIGNCQSLSNAIIYIFVIWFFCVLILPSLLNSIIDTRNDRIASDLALDAYKLKIGMDFESEVIKKYGRPNSLPIKLKQKIAEEYWTFQFKHIAGIEENYKKQVVTLLSEWEFISLFTPTTFYNLTTYEVSSRGYGNYIKFYTYLQQLRHDFQRWWIDQRYYTDQKTMKYFVTNNQNVFIAHSRLPRYYIYGIMINLLFCILLYVLSYYRFYKNIFKFSQNEIEPVSKVNEEWQKGKTNVYYVTSNNFRNFLMASFSGEQKRLEKYGVSGTLRYEDVDFFKVGRANDFCYIPRPDVLPPDLPVLSFLETISDTGNLNENHILKQLEENDMVHILGKRFGELGDNEKFYVLLMMLYVRRSKVYLIDEIVPLKYQVCLFSLKRRIDELRGESLVIYLTGNPEWIYPNMDYAVEYQCCSESWELHVERMKHQNNRREKRGSER